MLPKSTTGERRPRSVAPKEKPTGATLSQPRTYLLYYVERYTEFSSPLSLSLSFLLFFL
jgi:hypothetical protein